jgi:molybdenum cofactor cytidylyltransferase
MRERRFSNLELDRRYENRFNLTDFLWVGKMGRISAILLAAGESKRMGMNKLSLPWGKKTVLEHCLRVLLSSQIGEVLVVVNKQTWELGQRLIGPRVTLVYNPQSKKGMSTSIRKGIQAMDQKSRAVLIALGDHPLLKANTVNDLIRAYVEKKGTIIVPVFRGKRGHPVLFDGKYGKELLKLKNDVGARALLERHGKEVYEVNSKSEGVVVDIDTWEEYQRRTKPRG